ncbi:MAG: ribbon-helix-helix domain-containing protein [Deltaproteobacteria bacterium]|nr:ribbon-helix-helix domain-containing protein [Deltaproteobacteria bacterium]
MVRTQIQLTTEQARELKKLALSRQASISELVRKAVDDLIKSKNRDDTEDIKKRALEIMGKYHSGKKDISKKHDIYLKEFESGRLCRL